MPMTQRERVQEYIERNGSITSLQAINELGVMDLPRRICDLIQLGVPINKKRIKVRDRYGETKHVIEYSIKED